ncbi:DapH/DapD/GlmU-related protein [Mesorhizobium sp. KR2-14]|uniref:DapH/DapD/GlmU-related protein n=1 Tax=Mesorhizobium sp. KR2-14 TaxID=3156610 RepID=UPI0032B52A88
MTIGTNVFIAPNVGIYTAGHPMDVARRNQGLEYALPITIHDNVWLGGGVSLLPGVTLGEGCVIGAGCVVTKNVPRMVLFAGNPGRVVRPITDADKLKFG